MKQNKQGSQARSPDPRGHQKGGGHCNFWTGKTRQQKQEHGLGLRARAFSRRRRCFPNQKAVCIAHRLVGFPARSGQHRQQNVRLANLAPGQRHRRPTPTQGFATPAFQRPFCFVPIKFSSGFHRARAPAPRCDGCGLLGNMHDNTAPTAGPKYGSTSQGPFQRKTSPPPKKKTGWGYPRIWF
jgi:hypothetical protein